MLKEKAIVEADKTQQRSNFLTRMKLKNKKNNRKALLWKI